MYIPTQEYIQVINAISAHDTCELNKDDQFIYCRCDKNLESLNAYPSLQILVGDNDQ